MTPEYKPGDVVDVTIKDARVYGADHREHGRSVVLYVPVSDGRSAMTRVWPDSTSVVVEIVQPAPPAEWPPRQKDLWRDRGGELWFAVDVSPFDPPAVRLVPSYDAAGHEPEEVRKSWSPLTLVHREEGAA